MQALTTRYLPGHLGATASWIQRSISTAEPTCLQSVSVYTLAPEDAKRIK